LRQPQGDPHMMNKKEFNHAADAGPPEDSARNARARKAGARVIEYADIDKVFADDAEAGQALKDKMDSYMEPIDRDPTSFETIIQFGTDPIEQLGKVARDTLRIQSQLGEQVKTMNIAMENMIRALPASISRRSALPCAKWRKTRRKPA